MARAAAGIPTVPGQPRFLTQTEWEPKGVNKAPRALKRQEEAQRTARFVITMIRIDGGSSRTSTASAA